MAEISSKFNVGSNLTWMNNTFLKFMQENHRNTALKYRVSIHAEWSYIWN